jgi:hypothetical protein
MRFRCVFAALALTAVATESEAGPLRRSRPVYQPSYPPARPAPSFAPPAVSPAGGFVAAPTVVPAGGSVSNYSPAVTAGSLVTVPDAGGFAGDGLGEVNAQRAARGLRPFARDEGLAQAARACAEFRAAHGLFGHTANDFGFLPPGAHASSAGCAAYPAGYGWMSCCVYDNYTYAGAAWVTGRDGRRYMHLFVR